mmetsp:Transcript_12095/g.33488  ORF Transcript_12095/g.33488 Transcript_12095/m.33488 type:complete len:216 (+) Transcript_12095:483-1130(+)
MAQQNILWFQIAMNHVHVGSGKERQCPQHLSRKLSYQIERNPSKLCVLEQFIQVERKHLKHKTLVIPIHKVSQQTNNIMLIFQILFIQMCQQLNFRLGLHQKGFLRFDNLDGYFVLGLQIFGPHYLPKASFANALLDAVPIVENFTALNDVVVILVIPPVVVGTAIAGVLGFVIVAGLGGSILSSLIALFVVHGIDVLVSINETNRKLHQRSIGR